MNQRNIIAIRKGAKAPKTKLVESNQKAIDALPFNSGMWRVAGLPGLYIRCRAQSKSYWLQRRVGGELVKRVLGDITLKEARAEVMREWQRMKPTPAPEGVATFGQVFEEYLATKRDRRGSLLADKTKHLYRYNCDRYLAAWKDRSMEAIGKDRAGVRFLQGDITRRHGRATANQVIRLVSAIYRWRRDVDAELPEPPTTAVRTFDIAARDWALSENELRAWWSHEAKGSHRQKVASGVSILGPLKKMWWLAALFTGARKGSIEALKWTDLDFAQKTIRFEVTKGDRPYMIPISDKLAELLTAYRESEDVPPSEWVFPSTVKDGEHIVGVKNDKEGVPPAHRLRHTYRTTLAQLGATPDQARLLLGHSRGKDVSANYITDRLLIESLRPIVNAVSERYLKILNFDKVGTAA